MSELTIKRILLRRLDRLFETERLFPLIALVISSVCLFTDLCKFPEWSVFVGANVLGGSAGALIKKKFVDPITEKKGNFAPFHSNSVK